MQFSGEAKGNARYDKSLKNDSTLKLLEQQRMTWHKAEHGTFELNELPNFPLKRSQVNPCDFV